MTAPAYRRLNPDERRSQLLAFGRQHFAGHAFDALSLSEIADRAQVSKGTLYNYFGGRRGFYLSTITTAVDGMLEAIAPPADAVGAQALEAMSRAFVAYAQENRGIYLALIRGGLGSDPEVTALLDRVREVAFGHVVALFELPQPTPLQRIAILGWVSFVENATATWLAREEVAVDRLVALFATTLISTLKACP
jgi:AcrR family transcriptional regulator